MRGGKINSNKLELLWPEKSPLGVSGGDSSEMLGNRVLIEGSIHSPVNIWVFPCGIH